MYQPENPERPQYPMFPKVNGRVLSFLSGTGAVALALAASLGVALFFLTGLVERDVEVPLSVSERAEEVGMLRAARDVLVYEDTRASMERLEALGEAGQASQEYRDLSARNQAASLSLASVDEESFEQLKEAAAARGIGEDTTDEEIEAMVASTKVSREPYLGDFERGIALVAAPCAFALMLFAEPAGCSSLASALSDARAFARRRRELYFVRSGR